MENKDKVIQGLFTRLEQLSRQQKDLQDEIRRLSMELQVLSSGEAKEAAVHRSTSRAAAPQEKVENFLVAKPPVSLPQTHVSAAGKSRTPWEEFIGTNLLNKVGIGVLVVGIGFGVKYSIDRELLTDLARTILGYLAGIALVGIAFRLKKNHTAFSAVLLSGGMAVLYFITYTAFAFFGLIPQEIAFAMMVLFTFFTVFASLQYNIEVIGIIGLVGAYGVPLLLSDGSGKPAILFSYMSIINTGVLFLAFKKYWRRLYYSAFVLTWLTFASWYAFSFDSDEHAAISLVFSTVFFLIFYTTFIAYKLIRREVLGKWDVVCILTNSFAFFGYGYLTLDSLEHGGQFLGLFTLATALMHLIACVIVYRKQERFTDTFYLVAGLVLVFLTIAVPVQLEGNWVTLVWAAEAALLFWIGRVKLFPTYEKLSYPLIALAIISLLHDWSNGYPRFYFYPYGEDPSFTIFLNVQFLTSLFVGASLIFMLWVVQRHPEGRVFRANSGMGGIVTVGIPLLALVVFYGGFYKEIEAFWNNQYAASRVVVMGSEGTGYDQYDDSLLNFKNIWLIIYSAIFGVILCLLERRFPKALFAFACLGINAIVLFIFITAGLLDLRAMRSAFLEQELAEYYHRGPWLVVIRYAAILSVMPLLWFNRKLVQQKFFRSETGIAENLFFHMVVLALLSSELIHWLDMARVENTFELSLSILWGAYAFFLIVLGLSREQKHLRLAAIVLFGVTLVKLFAYDMADMSTILKTVVMIVLGVLLLSASFIYNKYKRAAGNEVP